MEEGKKNKERQKNIFAGVNNGRKTEQWNIKKWRRGREEKENGKKWRNKETGKTNCAWEEKK